MKPDQCIDVNKRCSANVHPILILGTENLNIWFKYGVTQWSSAGLHDIKTMLYCDLNYILYQIVSIQGLA